MKNSRYGINSKEFLSRLRGNDHQAVTIFCEELLPKVKRYYLKAFGLACDDAASFANEAIATALQKIVVFRGDSQLSTFVFGIARYTVLRELRRKYGNPLLKSNPRDFLDWQYLESLDDSRLAKDLELLVSEPNFQEEGRNRVSRADLIFRQAWASLKECDQRILLNSVFSNSRAIAELEHISNAAVRSRLHRSRRRLRLVYMEIKATLEKQEKN